MITVKVRRLGQASKRVSLEEGATVSDALEEASVELRDGEAIFVNGDTAASADVEVYDGDSIILQSDVKLGC